VNAFLESIWTSLGGAVVVLDDDMRILVWSQRSEDLWGVRQDEVQGKHLFNLDIGLPVDQVLPVLRAALADGGREPGVHIAVVQATNRRGKQITCRVSCSSLLGGDKRVRGVIVIIEQEPERIGTSVG